MRIIQTVKLTSVGATLQSALNQLSDVYICVCVRACVKSFVFLKNYLDFNSYVKRKKNIRPIE
jgi:hypothetical protein